jgi:hypothetical protein
MLCETRNNPRDPGALRKRVLYDMDALNQTNAPEGDAPQAQRLAMLVIEGILQALARPGARAGLGGRIRQGKLRELIRFHHGN